MNAVGNVQKWLTFGLSAEQENRFRKTNFGADVTQARIFIFLIILPFITLAVNDYGFFGLSRIFYGLLALRLAFVAYTILFFKSLRKLQNYRSYDRAEFFWGLSLALIHIAVNSTRPTDFVAHTVAIVLSVFVIVIAIPNRFTNQLILSLVFTVGQTLIIAPNLWTSPQASFTVLLNMLIATAIAITSSWLLHFWRRQEFLTREEIQKSRVETEMQLTERKKAEEALEKIQEAHIKEIHHRIKNNLQVISSLLSLEAEKFSNTEVLEAFKESQNRVTSIALIHEELYKGTWTDNLNFASYLRKLTADLLSSYNLLDKDVSLKLDIEEVYFDMDTAIPLGTIVNELVSNSFKHAFPSKKKREIQIKLFGNNLSDDKEDLAENGTRYTFIVSDNGVGIPEEIYFENTETLGLQLVNILVDQLDGKIELKRDNGTEFTISFSAEEKNNQASA